VGNFIKVLLQISSRLPHWKNFENRRVFDEVMPKILLVPFFAGHGVLPWCYLKMIITASQKLIVNFSTDAGVYNCDKLHKKLV